MWSWIRRILSREPPPPDAKAPGEDRVRLDNSDIDREWDDLGRIRQRLDVLIHSDNGRIPH